MGRIIKFELPTMDARLGIEDVRTLTEFAIAIYRYNRERFTRHPELPTAADALREFEALGWKWDGVESVTTVTESDSMQ